MSQKEDIKKAVKILHDGGIIIFPTDTAFGIGCRIDSKGSVDRLFALRKRSIDHATPVLVSSIDMALRYFAEHKELVLSLMKKYWPGALTIVSTCHTDQIYSPIRGGKENIGLRMPDHPVPLFIIRELGVPILGPSANFHGEKTPFLFEALDQRLMDLVDFVVPGDCAVRRASTVVDCSTIPISIVRQGAVQLSEDDMKI